MMLVEIASILAVAVIMLFTVSAMLHVMESSLGGVSIGTLTPAADTSAGMPPHTVIQEEVIIHELDWKSVLPVFVIAIGIVVVAVVVVWLFKFYRIKSRLNDIQCDKYRIGPYALTLPGACGSCTLRLDVVKELVRREPRRFCILHDRRRKLVQRLVFNTRGSFPFEMVFDYNDKYFDGKSYDFTGCSYIILSRRDRRKLATFMRRSRYDSSGMEFAINELETAERMSSITNEDVQAAKAEISAALRKQQEIISRMASEVAGDNAAVTAPVSNYVESECCPHGV